MLSQTQQDEFWTNGFLLVEDALDAARLRELRHAADDIIAAAATATHNDDRYDLERDHSRERPRVRRIKDPHTAHPAFDALLRDAAALDMAARLIGDNLRFAHTKLNVKPGGGGEAVLWRQDWAFYPHTNDDIVEVGLMLDDSTAENGPLMMIPGSHRGPIYDHRHEGCFVGAFDIHAAGIDRARARELHGRAGSITVHHVRTAHGSRANRSNRDRRLLLLCYAAADAWPLPAHLHQGAEAWEASLLRGASTMQPRLVDTPVRMPYPPAPHQGSIFENQRAARGLAV